MLCFLLCCVFLPSLAAGPEVGCTRDLPRVSVCHVLKERSKYNGHVVAIRGEWVAGLETSYLSAECDASPLGLGKPWVPGVWLVTSRQVGVPAGFSTDRQALEMAYSAIEREHAWEEGKRVVVTIVGKLEVREPLLVGTHQSGNLVTNGFGHLAKFPVQLLIETVCDLRISPRKRSATVLP